MTWSRTSSTRSPALDFLGAKHSWTDWISRELTGGRQRSHQAPITIASAAMTPPMIASMR